MKSCDDTKHGYRGFTRKCEGVPLRRCHEVPTENCDTVEDTKCDLVPVQKCHNVNTVECFQVPDEVRLLMLLLLLSCNMYKCFFAPIDVLRVSATRMCK